MVKRISYLMIVLVLLGACDEDLTPRPESHAEHAGRADSSPEQLAAEEIARPQRTFRTVHVFVALCDNRHQGIVHVPDSLGNGQDSRNNLYWGAMYGVKTFFAQSGHWTKVDCLSKPEREIILDRLVFRGNAQDRTAYLVADAYDGAHMKEALVDFFEAAAGRSNLSVTINEGQTSHKLPVAGKADMVCFVGHNGLMDLHLAELPVTSTRAAVEWAVVLACKSRDYFGPVLDAAGCKEILTTTGLMAPEAYTLEAIVRSWVQGSSAEVIREQAAEAYAKYQNCSLQAARRLFHIKGGS